MLNKSFSIYYDCAKYVRCFLCHIWYYMGEVGNDLGAMLNYDELAKK